MTTKKPAWVIDKERARRDAARETVWLFGLHAVRDALLNPAREKLRLVVTKNALDKLADAVDMAGISPEVVDPRKFSVPIDEGSVHQGAALEARPQGGATEHTATLTAAGWTGDSAPYTQTVTVTGLAADAHLIVGLAPTVTSEEMEAAAAAMLLATAQAAGSITISAFGDKPEAALPILIMEVG